MRVRDGLALVFLGQAIEATMIYYGWDHAYNFGVNFLKYLILIVLIFGVSAIYDRWTIDRRAKE